MELYKIIISDDEYLIRELIYEKVNWADIGCEVVLKASCANEVYDYLEYNPVHIIVTDINMPVINGLEMSRQIRILYPKVRIIALTGYNDFEYAKKGIDIGIDGYVLKPIDKEVIESTVKKSLEHIQEAEKLASKTYQLTQIMKENEPNLKEKLFFDIVNRHIRLDHNEASMKDYGLDMGDTIYDISVIEIITNSDRSDIEQLHLLKDEAKKSIDCEFKQDCSCGYAHIFLNENNHIIIYATRTHNQCFETLKKCIKRVSIKHGIDIQIGQSAEHNCYLELVEAYTEANHALAYGRLIGNDFYCHYNDIQLMEKCFIKESSVEQCLDKLNFAIKTGLKEELDAGLNKLFEFIRQDMKNQLYKEYMTLQIYLARIISELDHYVMTFDINVFNNIKAIEPYNKLHDISSLSKIHSLSEARLYIGHYCTNILRYVNNLDEKQDVNIIDAIDTYLVENFGDIDLSLRKTANEFYLNASYLSRIYKKRTGQSFKEKLVELRMEEAIRLLKTTDLKVYEVGQKVGIYDPNYFSSCFKKYMNMSISDYRKKFNKYKE
jgi:two-component system response regulator YesN